MRTEVIIPCITRSTVITPNGFSLDENIESILQNRSAITKIDKSFIGENFPVDYCGSIDWSKCTKSTINSGESTHLSAIKLMLNDLNIAPYTKIDGIFVSSKRITFAHCLRILKDYDKVLLSEDELVRLLNHQQLVRELILEQKIDIPEKNIIFVDNTCTSGIAILNAAADRIRQKLWKRALVVAVDFADFATLHILHSLGALSGSFLNNYELASRPFDMNREGFVKSDGAAMALIEASDVIADPLKTTQILGGSQTSDAYRLTEGREDAEGASRAMEGAMKDAEISEEKISFIRCHGTSTVKNDRLEAKAIHDLFYRKNVRVPVCSLKGHLGHSTDASSLVETLIAAEAFRKGFILPARNISNFEFEFDLVTKLRNVPNKGIFLSNSFGFGGNNASIVLGVNDFRGK